MIEYPVIDPETGEVLALDAADAEEVRRLAAETLVTAIRTAKEARTQEDRARAVLSLLMEPGDALPAPGGYAVTVKPGAPARRAVNRQEVLRHAEALGPLGYGPTERVVQEFPRTSDLITTKARAALARVGLTPETFLILGDPGRPEVVVVEPEEDR